MVILKDDIRDDDAKGILNALKHIKGVISVTPNVSDGWGELVGWDRCMIAVEKKIYSGLHQIREGKK